MEPKNSRLGIKLRTLKHLKMSNKTKPEDKAFLIGLILAAILCIGMILIETGLIKL